MKASLTYVADKLRRVPQLGRQRDTGCRMTSPQYLTGLRFVSKVRFADSVKRILECFLYIHRLPWYILSELLNL